MSDDTLVRPKGRHSDDGEEQEKKGMFSFGKRKDNDPVPEPAPVAEPAEKKSRLSFGRKDEADEPAAASPEPVEEPEQSDFPDEPPAPKKKLLSFGTKEEDRKGTWGDSGYSATDEEAHRDVVYNAPSFLKQTMVMFMVQMKLYSKAKWTYFMLFMAVLIPVIIIALPDVLADSLVSSSGNSNVYTGVLLALLPIFMGFFTAVMCGPSIAREFKDRTAYMNVSLPMSRAAFYFGKYIAGFIMCLGVFMLAYGVSIMMSMQHFDTMFGDLILESLAATVVAIFAYTSTAFCLSALRKKPSTMMPFMLMVFVIPAILLLLDANYDVSVLTMMPFFLPDAALMLLGAPIIGSVHGFIYMMGLSYVDVGDLSIMMAIGVVWGVVFLALGLYRIMRREM